MDFNEISNTALSYYCLPPPHLWRPRLTVCAVQCDVIMTSEFVYIGVTLLLTRRSSSRAPV